jgi:ribosomal protein S18 acetylase RimI-like enzyme
VLRAHRITIDVMHDCPAVERSTSTIRIRTAAGSDMPAMISMINTAFVVEDFIEGTRTDEQRMWALMQKGEFLVAQDGDGQIVASVYVEVAGSRGYLGMLAVVPHRQGEGFGRELVKAAEKHCRIRGCDCMKLTVLSLRSSVLAFYRKLGYSETGVEEFRPSRPLKPGIQCHAIVMTKLL